MNDMMSFSPSSLSGNELRGAFLPQNNCGRRTVYWEPAGPLQSQNRQKRSGDHIVLRNALKMCPSRQN